MKDAESHDFQQVDVNSVPRSARVATLMRARSHEGFDGLESIESFFAAIRAAGTRQVLEGLPAYVTLCMDALEPPVAPGLARDRSRLPRGPRLAIASARLRASMAAPS